MPHSGQRPMPWDNYRVIRQGEYLALNGVDKLFIISVWQICPANPAIKKGVAADDCLNRGQVEDHRTNGVAGSFTDFDVGSGKLQELPLNKEFIRVW